MTRPTRRILPAAVAAAGISLLAHRAGSLSSSGTGAAWVVGTVVAAAGGWRAAAALVSFFASSSLLSRGCAAPSLDDGPRRGSRRDATQVAANGGIAAFAALGIAAGCRTCDAAFYGSVAAAAGDTWATEIGRRSRLPPRLLLFGPKMELGHSGGMTPSGTLGSILGAGMVGILAAGDHGWGASRVGRFVATAGGGIAGATADSVLGATVQAVRRCPACGIETERLEHCALPTVHLRGLPWLDNDGVNAAATLVGAAVGSLLGRCAR